MEKLIKIAIMAFTELRMAQRMTGKISAAALLTLFAFFTFLGMVGCGVAAFWLYLAPRVGDAGAAMWSAVLLFGFTAGLSVGGYLCLRGNGNGGGAAPKPFFDEIGAEVARAVGESKGSVLLSALLAGMAFGKSHK
ncbi:MAG: hypothetical protein ACYCZX_17125 [Rhodospirillaceae bacterium]